MGIFGPADVAIVFIMVLYLSARTGVYKIWPHTLFVLGLYFVIEIGFDLRGLSVFIHQITVAIGNVI